MSREAAVQAVKDHLVAGGILAGAESKPDDVGWQGPPGQSQFVPYAIVWPVGVGDDIRHLTLAGNHDDLRPRILVRTVGATSTQANALLDDVQTRMLQTAITVAGYHVSNLVPEGSISTAEDLDDVPHLWFTGAYYRLWLNPT